MAVTAWASGQPLPDKRPMILPWTPPDPTPSVPALALVFSDGSPVQFSDANYVEFSA